MLNNKASSESLANIDFSKTHCASGRFPSILPTGYRLTLNAKMTHKQRNGKIQLSEGEANL
jgi:hypothetical protein